MVAVVTLCPISKLWKFCTSQLLLGVSFVFSPLVMPNMSVSIRAKSGKLYQENYRLNFLKTICPQGINAEPNSGIIERKYPTKM